MSTNKPQRAAPQPIDLSNPPPLVPVRDAYSDRKRGKVGYLPYCESTIRERIRDEKIKIVKLGPRLSCIPRKTILEIQAHGLPV